MTKNKKPGQVDASPASPPTDSELATTRRLLEYWQTYPSALHEFRRAVFGDRIADRIRAHDFPPERYLEAADALSRCEEDEVLRSLRKTPDEAVAELRRMALNPDDESHREWLRFVEYDLPHLPRRP